MRIEFTERQPYLHWHYVYQPLVSVTLRANGLATPTYGILDSGADSCLFHSSLADDLGIVVSQGVASEIFGINPDQPIVGYTHTVEIDVGNVPIGEVEVDFSSEIEDDWSHQLIGRNPVFDRLRIGFRQSLSKGWIYLGGDGSR